MAALIVRLRWFVAGELADGNALGRSRPGTRQFTTL